MAQLPISNVINVSVSQASAGLGSYNTSNLAVFTDEQPGSGFGALGYGLYETPDAVATDFGTNSTTYAMANAVFSQQPNILLGGGQLVVIPMLIATQNIVFSAVPTSGTFILNYGANASAAINFNDTAAMIQTKLQAVAGLSKVLVTGSIGANNLLVTFYGVYGVASTMTVTSNTLNGGITVTPTVVAAGEKIPAAITRATAIVQFFGILSNESLDTIGQTDLLAAAAIIQPLVKMGFFVSHTQADIAVGGMLDLLRSGSFTQTRGLYYGDSSSLNDVVMAASYASRLLSVDFTGSNTTITMHLKQLVGVQPDNSLTQTILNLAIAAGADVYANLQGDAAVFTSGLNLYSDQVYNRLWFAGAIQIAIFNYLATTNTKVPQTEPGMDGFKGAIRQVCEQAVANQYSAPGSWNSATTFGNQTDLILNVAQRGYYIYSKPIALQAQADRVARKAPLCQVALKEAGAIQSGSVLVNVNA